MSFKLAFWNLILGFGALDLWFGTSCWSLEPPAGLDTKATKYWRSWLLRYAAVEGTVAAEAAIARI